MKNHHPAMIGQNQFIVALHDGNINNRYVESNRHHMGHHQIVTTNAGCIVITDSHTKQVRFFNYLGRYENAVFVYEVRA